MFTIFARRVLVIASAVLAFAGMTGCASMESVASGQQGSGPVMIGGIALPNAFEAARNPFGPKSFSPASTFDVAYKADTSKGKAFDAALKALNSFAQVLPADRAAGIIQANWADQYVTVKVEDFGKFAKVSLAKQTVFGNIYGLAYRKVQGEVDEVFAKALAAELGGVPVSKIATTEVAIRDEAKVAEAAPAEVSQVSLVAKSIPAVTIPSKGVKKR